MKRKDQQIRSGVHRQEETENQILILERSIATASEQLVLKNGQLRNGASKQQRSEEVIHERTKAMEAAADGIFIINVLKPGFQIVYANRAFRTMTGNDKTEIIDRDYISLYQPDADPRITEEIASAIRQNAPFYGEILKVRKNGERSWYLLRLAPVRDVTGTIRHYVGTQTDITLMRASDLKIKLQREELLHVTRVGKLAEFVSSLAHEISQPLSAILAYAEAARRMLAEREPKIQEILQHIIADDVRAVEGIKRMRSLLKKSEPDPKPLDINEVINETVAIIATEATVRNSVMKTDLTLGLPQIRGDRIQLQQVLLNLISNSFDAMENSRRPHEILVRTWRKNNDTLGVAVKDTGCGIPKENLPKLFTRFFTNKPDGLGMGLSISRSIVEAHGGRLEVENNADQGVMFSFTLPIAPGDAA